MKVVGVSLKKKKSEKWAFILPTTSCTPFLFNISREVFVSVLNTQSPWFHVSKWSQRILRI